MGRVVARYRAAACDDRRLGYEPRPPPMVVCPGQVEVVRAGSFPISPPPPPPPPPSTPPPPPPPPPPHRHRCPTGGGQPRSAGGYRQMPGHQSAEAAFCSCDRRDMCKVEGQSLVAKSSAATTPPWRVVTTPTWAWRAVSLLSEVNWYWRRCCRAGQQRRAVSAQRASPMVWRRCSGRSDHVPCRRCAEGANDFRALRWKETGIPGLVAAVHRGYIWPSLASPACGWEFVWTGPSARNQNRVRAPVEAGAERV